MPKSLGMSGNYINQIINHKKHPSPAFAMKISALLQLDFNDTCCLRITHLKNLSNRSFNFSILNSPL